MGFALLEADQDPPIPPSPPATVPDRMARFEPAASRKMPTPPSPPPPSRISTPAFALPRPPSPRHPHLRASGGVWGVAV